MTNFGDELRGPRFSEEGAAYFHLDRCRGGVVTEVVQGDIGSSTRACNQMSSLLMSDACKTSASVLRATGS